MKRLKGIIVAVGFVGLGLGACADAGETAPAPETEKTVLPAEKADQWGPRDDPSIFSNDLVYTLADLPR